ncbi:30S ribosomal protein S5 [Patescibacteria group bacterium]|nr:30S ribosomal protein S5 [Patescibacteria group bacterium]MBU1703522.1 30S ribosomal protein S5 [Patescibacteria group bacterium]MBU1953429.1 30S ribosomal protein S5 [Patescibacteria group bacterium]
MAKPQGNKRRPHVKEQKEFEEEVIQIDRVTRVVKGGRRLRFRATVVIGNKKGKVGVGIGKSTEVTGAIQKAISQAKKSLITVPIVGQTIPHRVEIQYKSAHLLIMPACPGTGIIAGGPLRKIIELAGVEDILSKSLGNNNKLTNSQAAIMALAKLKEIPWLKKKEPVKKEEKIEEASAGSGGQEAKKPAAKPSQKPAPKPAPQETTTQ